MVNFLPFIGFRYNENIPLSKVICPPYDVISKEERINFLNSHPYNFVHLTLGEKPTTDYKEIAETLREWIEKRILIKEDKGFYIYKQEFLWKGKLESSWGILGVLEMQPLGDKDILPHEQTFQGPKKDRLEVLRYCNTNFEPIWGIYEDKEGFVANLYKELKEKPLLEVEGWDKRKHIVWKLPSSLEENLEEFFRDKKILIADGHHRYEASWLYYKERGEERFRYIFILLTDLYDPGVKILPTHRILRSDIKISPIEFSKYFEVNEETFDKDKINLVFNPSDPFIYFYNKEKLYRLSPKANYLAQNDEKSNIWWVLPTTLLQKGIWEGILNKKEGELQEKDLVRFSHSIEEVLETILEKEFGSAFLLPTIPLEIIYALAMKGERLPQKSTYFYPKPVSGLIFWKVEDEK